MNGPKKDQDRPSFPLPWPGDGDGGGGGGGDRIDKHEREDGFTIQNQNGGWTPPPNPTEEDGD
jgi:hypothetical protein